MSKVDARLIHEFLSGNTIPIKKLQPEWEPLSHQPASPLVLLYHFLLFLAAFSMNWMANAKHRVRIVEKRGREREPSFPQAQKRARQTNSKGPHQQQTAFVFDQHTTNAHGPSRALTASDSHRRSSDLVLLSPLQKSSNLFDLSPPRMSASTPTPAVTIPTKATLRTSAAATTSSHRNQESLLTRDAAKTSSGHGNGPSATTPGRQLDIIFFNNGHQCHEDGLPLNACNYRDEVQACVQGLFEGALDPLQHYRE